MVKWQIASSPDKDYIYRLAILKGWYEDPQKVQVKKIKSMEIGYWWVIEPYEEGCNCPDLVYPSEAKSDGY